MALQQGVFCTLGSLTAKGLWIGKIIKKEITTMTMLVIRTGASAGDSGGGDDDDDNDDEDDDDDGDSH